MDVPPSPSVPGFVLDTLLRFSRSGELWLGRRQSGEPVSLTLVAGAMAATAAPLTTFRQPAVLPVLEVVAAGRCLALVSPVPPGSTLASLSVTRPVLDPGEVVGLGVPLAQALAAAHDRGLEHGDLDPVDIAIDDTGRPVLTGLGVASLSGAGVAPADDVHALAMILRSLLGDDAGPRAEAIRAALGPALSGHPAARPEAGELAGYLSLCCPPQPLRRSVPAPVSPPDTAAMPRRRHGASRHHLGSIPRPSNTAVTAALAVAGLVLLVLAAPLFGGGHHSPAPIAGEPAPAPVAAEPRSSVPTAAPPTAAPPTAAPPTAAPPTLSATQWQHTLQRLADARDRAFARLDPSSLAAADAPGSTAAAVDAGRVASLRAAEVHAAGLNSTVLGVSVKQAGADAATVTFEESTGAYDLVNAGGLSIEHRPAEAGQRWAVTLVNTPAGWRTATAQSAKT